MKKIILIVLVILFSSCEYENKFGVSGGLLNPPHFEKSLVTKTISKEIGCGDCIQYISDPLGYPIRAARVIDYEVVYEIDGNKFVKTYYIGKVLTEKEENDPNYLRLLEDIEP